MEQVHARAALVPAPTAADGLTTTIARSEIQDVLAAKEEPIELVLEITRSPEGEDAETRNVAVTWERSDLERLLEEAQDGDIVLTFDREALSQAMDSDVEAHGIRESALVLAVAATAAVGGAGVASAEPGAYLGSGAPIVDTGTPEIPYLSHGQGVTEADLGIATGTSPDDRAVARVDAPTLSPDDRAVARTDPAAAATPAGPEIPYLSHGQGVTEADLGIATGTSPDDRAVARVDAPTLSPDDRALPRTDPVAATGGTASDPGTFSAPSPETVAIAALMALAITGAFFMVGGRRRPRPGTA